ncbi:V/A-type H+-transporting ATPase subunit I [Modicisalibacter ilicicola DSM 19980]|uniref:V/A-type H+-transporting ATPase subunit I n=1 Tax=Modicisalibacter ilicicola DSM 19980 TaxID=1121942 RepID=A0A1M4SKQ1_9GAMM|nr:V-type ATP synthase subunit I [Halomonas ilicicola]SHE32728.1 V/A-type H+-transporting ATPase subunit I [Halomonas ilicicola DSM 19980]
MSIVPLRRVTLLGRHADKQGTLGELQRLGVMHLIDLGPEKSDAPAAAAVSDTRKALAYLLDCPIKRHQVANDPDFDHQAIVERALENQRRMRDLEDSIDFTRQRLKDLDPWGDFDFPPLESLAGHRLWFYEVPHYKARQLAQIALPWQEVHRDNRNRYIAVISQDEPAPDALPVPRTHTGSVPRHRLREKLQRLAVRLDEHTAEREALTRWIHLLHRHQAQAEDAANLARAQHLTRDLDAIFAVQGWVPKAVLDDVRRLAECQKLALLDEPVGPEDQPPTLLDNDERTAGGAEIVHFYQMPGYRSWDPSRVIFFSFAIFFAMILADAGYALLLLGAILFLSRRLERRRAGTRVRNLGFALVGFAFVYGVLAGSYFGWSPPPGSWLAHLWILDVNDFGQMMQLAIGIGLAHLIVANATVAWHHRGQAAVLAPLGWIVALMAGVMLFYGITGGAIALTLGLIGVFVFTDTRPIHRPLDLLKRVGGGLYALTNVTRAFGDVLSYLRLFALGLASASLAVTFNQLAADAAAAFPGLGILLYALILIVGHALNFVLAVVSGVVHGLRLNLIEFYHWGISDEGYPFTAFAKTETTPWSN